MEPHQGQLVLAAEIGGTTMRLRCSSIGGSAASRLVRTATPNYLRSPRTGSGALIRELFDGVRVSAAEILTGRTPDLVIVAYPGPVSSEGIALRSPTILGPQCRYPVDVRAEISRIWPTARVHVVNDLTAAGYFFVERGYEDFCVITVGSGIGSKVFVRRSPQVGPRGHGGEIGHVRARPKPDSPVADMEAELGEIASGRGTTWIARSWLERYPRQFASSMLSRLRRADDESWAIALAAAFRRRDALALRIVEAAAFPLAHAISEIHMAIGVDRFFIVGGFARALGPSYPFLLAAMARHASWDVGQRWHEMIQTGETGTEEGLLGAHYLARMLARGFVLGLPESA